MKTIDNILTELLTYPIEKIILSKPQNKSVTIKKIVITQKIDQYQMEQFTEKQVFHQTLTKEEVFSVCLTALEETHLQCNAWDHEQEHMILISRQGKISYKKKSLATVTAPTIQKEHNRKKNYLLPEGTIIPPLVDMGVFTKEGKVVHSMYDKFKQINRFVEIVDDAFQGQEIKHLNIIDFGCGKSYLTFILYYYFTEIKKISVKMVGLDLKEDVIRKCNTSAQKYGYDNLTFQLGDINGFQCDFPVDVVISLHACDTATDYALYNAIQWGAENIFSVPCCQHELNNQMKSDDFSLFTHYGIIQERIAALMTDAIRGNLLEAAGYRTQILEFIDISHTPKNLLIRAKKRTISQEKQANALAEAERVMKEFHLSPTLYQLLYPTEK